MSAELQQLEQQLVDLELFMNSRAYLGYKSARRMEIADVKERILLLRPINSDYIAQQLLAFGELDTLEEMEKIFETNRIGLKAKISDLADLDNQSATETKV